MQQSRFCVLTGHLNDYPLGDLVGILRHQQKSGRLLIEYEKGPAMFFFKNGELVDVQLDKLSGLQAICVALGQPPASFNFNPLIQPTRRSIEPALQRTVSELLGCWDESAIEIESTAPEVERLPEREYETPVLLSSPPEEPILKPSKQVTGSQVPRLLALPPAPVQSRYGLIALTIAVGGLLVVALSTLIGTSGSTTALPNPSLEASASGTRDKTQPVAAHPTKAERRSESRNHREATKASQSRKDERAATAEPAKQDADKIEPKANAKNSSGSRDEEKEGRSVKVLLQVADGRVTKASISNHQPGMDAYEALALRIARQRRYPAKAAGQQVITIKVNQP